MGNIIAKSYEVIQKEQPDALLVLGDTNSAMSAISAKRLKCPIFHMEAGNRCWDWNVSEMINRKIVDHIADINLPYTEHSRRYLISEGIDGKTIFVNRCWDWNVSEMINRKIVDHIADINLPYTEHSRRYLISEGIDGKTIFVTGSPMQEVLQAHMHKIEKSDVLERLNLEKGKYILVSAHREENIDNEENFMDLMNSINNIAEKYQMPVIYSTHPRSKKFIDARGFKFHPLVQSMKPFGFMDYNHLQMNSFCVLSDSGTLSEESAMLNFPGVLIRTSTERPEVLDKGTVVIGGIKGSFCVLSDSGTLSEESAMLNFPGVLIRTSTERPEVLDKGTVVIGGIKGQDVEQAMELAVSMYENNEEVVLPHDYVDTNVSVKVVKLIQSYTHIVNKTVWGK